MVTGAALEQVTAAGLLEDSHRVLCSLCIPWHSDGGGLAGISAGLERLQRGDCLPGLTTSEGAAGALGARIILSTTCDAGNW